MSPFRGIAERLNDVPGLGTTAIETVIAEIGTDMSLFPTGAIFSHGQGLRRASTRVHGKRRSPRIKKRAPFARCSIVTGT